jgi:hypothetical protein
MVSEDAELQSVYYPRWASSRTWSLELDPDEQAQHHQAAPEHHKDHCRFPTMDDRYVDTEKVDTEKVQPSVNETGDNTRDSWEEEAPIHATEPLRELVER